MNWIKENKIRIIIIAVAVVLLAGIGTVIALNTKQTKIDPADSNQSDVVINESSKEDVTTKKDDVIKESESTTEAEKEEENPGAWLMDLIEVMTYQELCRRRVEHREIRKKIY